MVKSNTFQAEVEQAIEADKPVSIEAARFFVAEIYKAVQNGRIMQKDRVLQLWPVIKEINDEQIRIRRYERRLEVQHG